MCPTHEKSQNPTHELFFLNNYIVLIIASVFFLSWEDWKRICMRSTMQSKFDWKWNSRNYSIFVIPCTFDSVPLLREAATLLKISAGLWPAVRTRRVILVRIVRYDSNQTYVYTASKSSIAKYPFFHFMVDPVKICLVKHFDVFEAVHSRVLAQSIKNQKQKARAATDRSVGADQCGMKKGREQNGLCDEI